MCLRRKRHSVYRIPMRYKILFLFITIGAVFQLAAQGRVKLTGRVYDSDNQPIELATVRVAGTTMGTMTDLKGEYQLSIPAGDSIVVIYSCLGYREERRQLLNLTKDVSLSVRLNKNAKMLNEVVVATHRRQTSTLQTIDTKDLKLMPDATGGSIEAMLTTFAGVNSSNELSSQYSVRGGNFDENIVYINGIEVYRPLTVRSGQQEGLSIINPDMVGRRIFVGRIFGRIWRQDVVGARYYLQASRSVRRIGVRQFFRGYRFGRTEYQEILATARRAL